MHVISPKFEVLYKKLGLGIMVFCVDKVGSKNKAVIHIVNICFPCFVDLFFYISIQFTKT